jgi:hypothetical protein
LAWVAGAPVAVPEAAAQGPAMSVSGVVGHRALMNDRRLMSYALGADDSMTVVKKKDAKTELKEGRMEVRSREVDGWNVTFESWPPADYRPLFHGAPDDACPAVHYGYCLAGKARATYTDGRKETIQAGDAYVLEPGHVFEVLEHFETVEFTQATEAYGRTVEVAMKNFPAWLQANRKRVTA